MLDGLKFGALELNRPSTVNLRKVRQFGYPGPAPTHNYNDVFTSGSMQSHQMGAIIQGAFAARTGDADFYVKGVTDGNKFYLTTRADKDGQYNAEHPDEKALISVLTTYNDSVSVPRSERVNFKRGSYINDSFEAVE